MTAKQFKSKLRHIMSASLAKRKDLVDQLVGELFPETVMKFDDAPKSICLRCNGKGFIVERQRKFDI